MSRRKNQNSSLEPDKAKIYAVEPADKSLELFRRFGLLNDLGDSVMQFNIYVHPKGGYILRRQDETGENEDLFYLEAGHFPTFAAVYDRIIAWLTDMLLVGSGLDSPASFQIVYDTTPNEERQYVCLLALNEGGVEETREEHGTELLANYP